MIWVQRIKKENVKLLPMKNLNEYVLGIQLIGKIIKQNNCLT